MSVEITLHKMSIIKNPVFGKTALLNVVQNGKICHFSLPN